MFHSTNCNKEYYNKANQPCCLDAMIEKYGLYDTAMFCRLNAFKYEYRRGYKPNESYESDTEKMNWYLNKYNELLEKFYESMGDSYYDN